MKNSELIKLLLAEIKKDLRNIVREEINTALDREVKRSDEQTAQHGKKLMNLTEIYDDNVSDPEPVEEEFTFTKNPVLNKILNKTAKQPRTRSATPVKMDDLVESYNSEDYEDFGAAPTMKKMLTSSDVSQHQTGLNHSPRQRKMVVPAGKDPDAIPDHLKKIFSRDYSQLVDKITEKK